MSVLDSLEPHRAELTGHCYRMLGSITDAEDAVQETMVRAWRAHEGFDGRSQPRTWLYRIATNVCIDQLRSRARRRLPTEQGPVGTVDDELVPLPDRHWLEPVPDQRAIPDHSTPERRAELRQSLRLAFVTALQVLPPRQRAALLLKDVLGFSAAEIAATLEITPAAVNSALQRARSSLAEHSHALDLAAATPAPEHMSPTQVELLERYVDAFHAYDVDELVALLREDGTMCMPPFTLWLQGRAAVRDWFLGRGAGCRGSRLVPTHACGQPAFGQYHSTESGMRAWALVVLDLHGPQVARMTFFLDVERLFPAFGLELELPHDAFTH